MSDVFISYSRKDETFVDPLYDALTQKGLTIWIDRNSILASQAWWDEIKRGMDTSNNFVIIMSPNSMSSPICQMEIEYALATGKRIIPVLYQDFDSQACIDDIAKRLNKPDEIITRQIWGTRQGYTLFHENHGALFHRNYVAFKEADDFDKKFTILYNIINTDFAHQENHTLLGLRAQTWDVNKRDVSFLLHGEELTRAETWLIEATQQSKDPAPTKLHTDYIHTSRDDENMRRRRVQRLSFLSVFMTIFAISAFLAGIFAIQDANSKVLEANNRASSIEKRSIVIEDVVNRFAIVMAEEQGNPEKQLFKMNQLIEQYPDEPYAYFSRGLVYALAEDNENAIRDFDEAIRLDPQFARAYNNRGIAYNDLEQYERAIQDFDEAIRLNPTYAIVYNNRGVAYAGLKQYERAIEDYDDAIWLNSEYVDAYNNRGVSYTELPNYELAIADFHESIHLDSDYVPAYTNRGVAYFRLGNYYQAINNYNLAISRDSEYALAYFNRSQSYGQLARLNYEATDYESFVEQAEKDGIEAVRLDPRLASSTRSLSQSLTRSDDLDGDGISNNGADDCPDVAGLYEFRGCPNPDTDGDDIDDAKEPEGCVGARDLGFGINGVGCPITSAP